MPLMPCVSADGGGGCYQLTENNHEDRGKVTQKNTVMENELEMWRAHGQPYAYMKSL